MTRNHHDRCMPEPLKSLKTGVGDEAGSVRSRESWATCVKKVPDIDGKRSVRINSKSAVTR